MFLYIRMLLVLLVNLYISRLILNGLGIVDYGIYNVVGGVVGMFTILSNSLSNAISRFLTLSIGQEHVQDTNIIFNTSICIQGLISIVILFFCELIGVWFLNYKMVIPISRLYAANWVLQLSIFTFLLGLISVPYNALIIAHEKMSAFAYIGIVEVCLKFLAAVTLFYVSFDRLVLWAVSLSFISLIIRLITGIYCSHFFPECKIKFLFDRAVFKHMGGFAGWSFIGEAAGILKNEGTNILLNLFFGPIVNAANGVAMQVNSIIFQFSNGFLTAVNPQITKRYNESFTKSYQLVKDSTRLCFCLIFIIVIPLLYSTKYLLNIWLHNVPDYSVSFVRLILVLTVVEVFCYPMITLQRATGVMRNYQLVTGSIHLLNFPLSLLLMKIGFEPECVYYVAIFLGIINIWTRLYMLKRIIPIKISEFVHEVVLRVLFVILSTFVLLLILQSYIHLSGILLFIVSLSISFIASYLFGITNKEKENIFLFIYSKIK